MPCNDGFPVGFKEQQLSMQSPVNEDAEQVHTAQKQIRAEVH